MPDSDATATSSPEIAPAILSGYRILREIGRGGMGAVWLAHDERLDRRVAIKTLRTEYLKDDSVRERFMQEARALAMVNHPNVVRIYGLGNKDEVPHFVMEYVEGVPLLGAVQRLTVSQKVEILRKVCLAVETLHEHGIIHRDLKPGNVLIGADLEPKLLDFGLARLLGEHARKLSSSGVAVGTPQYFSPEQTAGNETLDERSDVFALGILLYETLTGQLPFLGETISEQAQFTCEADPELPRRVNKEISGDLQNVCLKALEKKPSDRYSTARDMAQDLGRILAGEPALAQPTALQRIVSTKIDHHLYELSAWRADEVISQYEFDSLRKAYDRLSEREDAWIMEFRRLTLPQVALYMGSWIVVVATALILLFEYRHLPPLLSLALAIAATYPAGRLGLTLSRKSEKRISIAYLLAFCFLVPITLLLFMQVTHLWSGFSRGKESLEFLVQFKSLKVITNAQMWWAIALSLPVYVVLRRVTKASVYSLVMALMISLLGMTTLLRLGLMEWDNGTAFLRILPIAAVLFLLAFGLELAHMQADSRYSYPFAVLFTFVALTGFAGQESHKGLERMLPITRGQAEYYFILNAGIYYVLQRVCDLFRTPQMRNVAKVFRFVIPGHILTSTLLLGLRATEKWQSSSADRAMHFEARFYEVILPILACAFIFGSLPKQMKNYLASGLIFLAIGLVRLQQNMLKDIAIWPVALVVTGFSLMLLAVKYPDIRLSMFGRKHA